MFYSSRSGPKVIKLFSCSAQVSMNFFLLINAFAYLLAEKISCYPIFTKKEFAIVSNLRLISRTHALLSMKSFTISVPGSTLFVQACLSQNLGKTWYLHKILTLSKPQMKTQHETLQCSTVRPIKLRKTFFTTWKLHL